MTSEREDGTIRITQQFRSRDAMVYDFRGAAGRLTLRVTMQAWDDGSHSEWRIEASTSTSPDSIVVAEQGATRALTLNAVARSWNQRRAANNLPRFDWDSVASAMNAVRAL